jgi:segregation and condensation protein B
MEREEQLRIAEALILAAPEPISAQRLGEIVPGARTAAVRELIDELNAGYAEARRAFEIVEAAGGFQVRTRSEFSPYLQQTLVNRPLRLSQAALETLAVIAYRQPVTRAEIEHVRGVDVGAVLRSLLERRLVRIAGHREVAGRPMLYGTTRRFLEIFGLARIEDLPTLRDLQEFAPPEGPAAGAPAPASVAEAADSLVAASDDDEEYADPDRSELTLAGDEEDEDPDLAEDALADDEDDDDLPPALS